MNNYVTLTNADPQGWRAPDTLPYIPVGKFEEVVSVIPSIKAELPNTNKRMGRDTYRSFLETKLLG